MNREYHNWYSHRLKRNMELLIFGHAGPKVLMFPTRDGRFYEYENLRIVEALASKINAGRLQLYCVDGINHETFYCGGSHPEHRIKRHLDFEEYLLNEVMPLMVSKNSSPYTIVQGCSLGAFHAINLAFRHPHLFQKVVAFSGRYDLTLSVEHFYDLFDGYYNDDIYSNTPCHFVSNLQCEWRLRHLRNMDIILVIGREDPFLENNLHFSRILWSKGIRHTLRILEGRAHQGYYWRRLAPLYL